MTTTLEPHSEAALQPLAKIGAAQTNWALIPIAERVPIIRELRHLVAENAEALGVATAAVSDRPLAEKLVSEVLPLVDACRWLERNAARLLSPRRCGKRGRPFWLHRASFEVQRQPHGLVLVIGPGNFPLFLPAVHSLHALVAGNAVLLKPAPATREVALAFADLALDAGLDPALLTILPESVEAAHDAISAGIDKVVFTGSSDNGRDLLSTLAQTNTPSVMELSGEDAVLVLADADLDLVLRALRFGARLNGGKTCIAPRRLIVVQSVGKDFRARLSAAHLSRLRVEWVSDDMAALHRVNDAEHALGASIFSRDVPRARALAARIRTGFVLINDLIVPTADPRMPFGGVKASGFGVTRGDEGLLEMTFPHVVAVRGRGIHPHFDETDECDANLFTSYIRAVHGRARHRFAACRDLFNALIEKTNTRKIRA